MADSGSVSPPSSRPGRREDSTGRASERPLVTGLPVVIGAVLVVVVLGSAALSLVRRPGLPARLANDYSRMAAGVLTPDVRTPDAARLSRALVRADLGFAPRVVSLEPEFALLGGRVHDVDGRPAAAWFYRSPSLEPAIVQAFAGTLDDLGPPDDVREGGGPRVVLYRKTTQTIVCWPEPPAVYCFSSTLPGEHVVAIARRHASPTPPAGEAPTP